MSIKTRCFYMRHWCYVVIGRSMLPEKYARFGLGVEYFRHQCDYGLSAEIFNDSKKTYDCIFVMLRARKPLRFDVVCKTFEGFYITRLPVGQYPSEVCEKFIMKHKATYDSSAIFIQDKRTSNTAPDDDYLMKFDALYTEAIKNDSKK